MLGKNPKGQKVLAEYDQHKTLSSEARQTLVKVVVAQLIHDCGPLVILSIIDQLSLLLFAVLFYNSDKRRQQICNSQILL